MRVKAWGMQGSPGIRHLVAYEVCLRLVLQKLFLKIHYLAWNVRRLLCQVGLRIGKGGFAWQLEFSSQPFQAILIVPKAFG